MRIVRNQEIDGAQNTGLLDVKASGTFGSAPQRANLRLVNPKDKKMNVKLVLC
jgi:hypothetical protein